MLCPKPVITNYFLPRHFTICSVRKLLPIRSLEVMSPWKSIHPPWSIFHHKTRAKWRQWQWSAWLNLTLSRRIGGPPLYLKIPFPPNSWNSCEVSLPNIMKQFSKFFVKSCVAIFPSCLQIWTVWIVQKMQDRLGVFWKCRLLFG